MLFYLFILLIIHITQQALPSNPIAWGFDPDIITGDHKAVESSASISPSTFERKQTFANSKSFPTQPRIILSLYGQRQQSPTLIDSEIGFKINIHTITSTGFNNTVTIYGANIYLLLYSYAGISNPDYDTNYQMLEFSNGNLVNTSSPSRSVTFTYANPNGKSYTSYDKMTDIILIGGYKIIQGSPGTSVNLNSRLINQSYYQVTIWTTSNTKILQVSFFRLTFNKQEIEQKMVSIFDIGVFQGTNSTQDEYDISTQPTASEFQFRNLMLGFSCIQLAQNESNLLITTNGFNPADPNKFWKIDGYKNFEPYHNIYNQVVNYQQIGYVYLKANIFHHRKPTCTTQFYFNKKDKKCYDNCPQRSFNTYNSNGRYCKDCFINCLTCSGVAQTQCTLCSSGDHRVINSSTSKCQCLDGYYSIPSTSVCSTCPITCQTCQSELLCTSCDAGIHRQLVNNSKCMCKTGYYEDTTCIPCSMAGCEKCQFTLGTGQSCLLCNNVDYERIQINNIWQCRCITGKYTHGNGSCASCMSSCSSCVNDNTCLTCDSNRNRIFNNTTNTCLCMKGFYQTVSSICELCHPSCLTCSLSASNCSSCSIYRTFTPSSINTCECNPGSVQSQIAGECTSLCGNGYLQLNEQCDDKNKQNNDGCSSKCQIQKYHSCTTSFYNNGTSLCYYDKVVGLTVENIKKNWGENKVTVQIFTQAIGCNMESLKKYLDSLVSIRLSSSRRLLTNSQVLFILSSFFTILDPLKYTGYLTLILEYTQSIQTLSTKQISLLSSSISSPQSPFPYFLQSPISSAQLSDSSDNILLKYFDNDKYNSISVISYVMLAIICINWVFVILGIALRKSLVAMENMLILQFVYFCIYGQKVQQLALMGLSYFGQFSTGFNIKIFGFGYQWCAMSKINQSCNAINNVNITFWIATFCLAVSLGLLIFKLKKQSSMDQMAVSQYETQRDTQEPPQSIYGADQSVSISYELPRKIQTVLQICIELTLTIYYLTAIQFLLTAINQGNVVKIGSIIWLAFIGIMFVGLWVIWIYFYPLQGISYTRIIKTSLQKISLLKFVSLIQFIGLIIWGAVLSIAPGIVSYVLLMIWSGCLVWLGLFKKIHRTSEHKIRSCVNQAITLLISIIYIILQYAISDGYGLALVVVLIVLIVLAIINNVLFVVREIRTEKQTLDIMEYDSNQMKNIGEQFVAQASRKALEGKDNRFQGRDLATARNRPLIDQSDPDVIVRNKSTELKRINKVTQAQQVSLLHEDINVEVQKSIIQTGEVEQLPQKIENLAGL